MPTYEYKCDACGNAFERFQTMSSAPVKKCPKCGKNKVRRLIGMGAGLIFKGSGFYITDYRSEGYKDQAKADSGKTADAAKPAEGSKPAADGKAPTGDATKTAASDAASAKPASPPPPPPPPPTASKSASKRGKK